MNTQFLKRLLWLAVAIFLVQIFLVSQAKAERIKDIATISGQRANQLIGYGLVVGLDGSGDQTTQSPFTLQTTLSMLQAMGVAVPSSRNIQMRNTAAVMVTAELPALSRPGQRVDITVSSIGNARSLRGGTLMMTPLRGADGQIYALAQGNVVVGGAGAVGVGGTSAQVNQLSSGRVPSGALVERSVPTQPIGEFVQLDLHRDDYTLMQRTASAIAARFGAGVAMPQDARSLRVAVPAEPMERISFMAALENLSVTPVQDRARVVINSRTGSVVMNQMVTLSPSAIAHGNLTIRIQAEPMVSQPEPFSRGETAVVGRSEIEIEQGGGGTTLVNVPGGASLDEVVRALNLLGAKPADLMSILQAMKASGALRADLEVI